VSSIRKVTFLGLAIAPVAVKVCPYVAVSVYPKDDMLLLPFQEGIVSMLCAYPVAASRRLAAAANNADVFLDGFIEWVFKVVCDCGQPIMFCLHAELPMRARDVDQKQTFM
jgi:hypothetical protein